MTFFDIFSKDEKEKTNKKLENKLKVIIDNREKNSLVASNLIALGFQIEFKQLEIADYLINDVAVERKTFSDLQSSIINKRIFDQLTNLKQYPEKLLIIEGNSELFLHENALKGFILSASLDYKISIIFTKDEKDTANYLSVLAKRTKNKENSIRQSITFKSKQEQQQYILEGFPNIGPIKAKALLKKFKTLKAIINSPQSELSAILGSKTKEFEDLLN